MSQEEYAMTAAGCSDPKRNWKPEICNDIRQSLDRRLDESLPRTIMECLYGDAAARTLGFTPCGLNHRGGLALALSVAMSLREQDSRANWAGSGVAPGLIS